MRLVGIFRSRALALGITAILLGAPAVLADTPTKTVGSNNGTDFSFSCPSGMALFGWGYNSTDHLTAIAPLCRAVVDGVSTQGEVPKADAVYGAEDPSAGSGEPITCPDDGIMRTLQVFVTERLQVQQIRPTCKGPNHAPVLVRPTVISGQPSTTKSNVSCPSGSYATGLIGTFSPSLATGGILSLGLRCFSADQANTTTADTTTPPPKNGDGGDDGPAPFGTDTPPPDTAAPPPDDATPPPPDNNDMADQGDQLIDMGNGGVSYGAKGKARVLKDASTLYSDKGNTEIAYFNKGDKVTVVACEQQGAGWCQAVRPQPGLIWGGDFK